MGIASDGLRRLEVADGRTDRRRERRWSSRAQKPSDPAPAASGNPICCACPEFKMGRLNRSEADLFLSMVSIYRVEKIGLHRAEGATREHETFRGPLFSARYLTFIRSDPRFQSIRAQ